VATLRHELWDEGEGRQTLCLAGLIGDAARAQLAPGSRLVWEVEAESHFEAMTRYHQHMGWGEYTTEQNWDRQPYPEEWVATQQVED
jgi:hypothetical protein